MKKSWIFLCGLILLIAASAFALTSPDESMTGEIFPLLIAYPGEVIIFAWRLLLVPLVLMLGTSLTSPTILARIRLPAVLLCWAALYFGYMVWRFLAGYFMLIQFFLFNQIQDFLFLFLLSSYTGLLLPQIFNPAKRYDVLCFGAGFLGVSLLSLSGWWAGPRGFDIGSIPHAILFTMIWLFNSLMIISPPGVILNLIRNLSQERKDWQYE